MGGHFDPNCPFCKIVSGEISSKKVYSDSKLIAVLDINPAARGHVLVVPKEHYNIMQQMPPEDFRHLARTSVRLSQAIKSSMVSTENKLFIANGGAAGQQVSHFFLHIIPEGSFSITGSLSPDESVYGKLRQKFQSNSEHIIRTANILASVPRLVAAQGHVNIVSNSLGKRAVDELFQAASMSASAVFEMLQAQGTNLIFHDGPQGISCDVIPRFSSDSLDFTWQPKKLEETEMDGIKNAIAYGAIGLPELESEAPVSLSYSSDNFISNKLRALR